MDKLQVTIATTFYMGLTLADINTMVQILVGVLTAGFIIYKWYKASKK